MAKQDEMIEQLKLINEKLDKLILLWEQKEDRVMHPKKAITTGSHSPMTPEQLAYARMGNVNKAESHRM